MAAMSFSWRLNFSTRCKVFSYSLSCSSARFNVSRTPWREMPSRSAISDREQFSLAYWAMISRCFSVSNRPYQSKSSPSSISLSIVTSAKGCKVFLLYSLNSILYEVGIVNPNFQTVSKSSWGS